MLHTEREHDASAVLYQRRGEERESRGEAEEDGEGAFNGLYERSHDASNGDDSSGNSLSDSEDPQTEERQLGHAPVADTDETPDPQSSPLSSDPNSLTEAPNASTATEAMRCALDLCVDDAVPPERRRSFRAAAVPIIEGMSMSTWAGPNGSAVPWSDRPRLLGIALAKCTADERWGSNDLHSTLRYVIPQQLDPYQAPRSNGPAPGSEGARVLAAGESAEAPGAGRGGSRPGLTKVDGLDQQERDRQQSEDAAVAQWASEHPEEAKAIRAELIHEVEADPQWRGMHASILTRVIGGRYRDRILKQIEEVVHAEEDQRAAPR